MLPFRNSFILRNSASSSVRSRRFSQVFSPAGSEINFKTTFLISIGLFFTFGGIYFATHLQHNVKRYQLAYQKIPDLISNRTWKHRIVSSSSSSLAANENSLIHQKNEEDNSDSSSSRLAITKSNESITIINASDVKNATAELILPGSNNNNKNHNKNRIENLGELSKLNWPEFLSGDDNDRDDDEVFITVGVRRAFGEDSPIHKLGFTHAVVLVELREKEKKKNNTNNGKKQQFSIFGYNAGKLSGKNPLFMLNDMNNVGVTKYFTFYNELTIQGNKKQARRVFERMEQVSDKPYKIASCNCFSPIFTSMLEEANAQEMKIPEYFMESLAICVPTEQNFGFGMSSNAEIKPYLELASAAVNVATKRKLVDVAMEKTK